MKNLKFVNQFFFVLLFLSAVNSHLANAALLMDLSDKRETPSFEKLKLDGVFEVLLVQGQEESVIIDADPGVAAEILTKVEAGTLKIYPEKKFNSSGKITITVNFKNLKSIDCSGVIKLNGAGVLKFDELRFDVKGACKTDVEITATELRVDISGSGSTMFKGAVPLVKLDISGSGKYGSAALVADSYQIDISGSGNAEVNAVKDLYVSVSGSGNVRYTGNPVITREISGTGRVRKLQ